MNSARKQAKSNLARIVQWSGLNHFKNSVLPQIAILTYHRVLPVEEAARYPFPGMVVSTGQFESHVTRLASRYRVLDFLVAIECLRTGSIPPRAVVVTFDDGYRDNFEHAFPILQKYGVPATFFVVSGAIDGQSTLWWDAVAHIAGEIAQARRQNNPLPPAMPDWLAALVRDELAAGDPLLIARKLVDHCNALPRREREERLKALSDVKTSRIARGDQMMSWDQVREMKRAGMRIGAHTVTHAFLDELDDGEAPTEVNGCFQTIEDHLGQDARLFAFPRGRCTQRLQRILERARVQAAVTTVHGLNDPRTDLFALKRLDGGYCDTGGTFDSAVFDVELGGWFTPFRRQ